MAHLHYRKGNIFDAHTQVIVNTVNCQGIMGKGLALAFKQKYPAMFSSYQKDCKTGKLHIGRPTLYQESDPWILNFPTKDSWRANSKIEYLEKGLEYFVANYQKVGIKSIAFPKLGAQNGKLSWNEVGPLMAKYLGQLDIDVYIYIADGDTEFPVEDPRWEKLVWQQFNEIALSTDLLQKEAQLSSVQAKKVAEKRKETEFTTFTELTSIDGIAKVSLKRMKDYINHLRHPRPELPGVEEVARNTEPQTKVQKHSSQQKRRTTKPLSALPPAMYLFQ